MPKAACSRSHHPAPIPRKARPPVSADRVAAALAVIPGCRKVTGVQSVPSRSPVPRPATAPSATHGSGIGSHARPTWGIWIRWSISASPANPASSAARATSRSQASGSSPHGNRETCSTTSTPVDAVRSPPAGTAPAVGAGGVEEPGDGSAVTGTTRSHPSSATSSATARARASWPASTVAGSGRSRAALRRRHSSSGVSRQHQHRGQARRPRGREPPAAPGGVEAEGVDHGRQPPAQPGRDDRLEQGERVGGRVQVVGPAAHDTAQGVGRDDLLRRGSAAPPRSTCPTRRRRPARPAPGRGATCGQSARSRSAGAGSRGRVSRHPGALVEWGQGRAVLPRRSLVVGGCR